MQLQFDGLTARMAKRKALNYWYQHRTELGMSLAEFLSRCRLRTEGPTTRIVFSRDQAA